MLPVSDYLDPAVPVRRVEEAVAEDWRRLTRCEFRLALGLRRLFRDYAHRRDGRGRFADWAEDRFGVPAKLALTFSFLGEHFERLALLRTAVGSGEVAWTRAREFAAVATEVTVAEWIAYAKSHTNRELERRRADREGKPAVPGNLRQQGSVCNQMIESGRLLVTGEAPFEEYRTASGEYLGIGYDPRRRRAPKADTMGPGNPHMGTGEEGREKASGEDLGAA
jgi:hypothetical protein